MSAQPLWQSVVAGVAGGVLNAVVGHPFDTIKVRVQAGQKDGLYTGLFDGIGSQMAGVTPFWMVFYFGYKLGRQLQASASMLALARAGAFAGADGRGCALTAVDAPARPCAYPLRLLPRLPQVRCRPLCTARSRRSSAWPKPTASPPQPPSAS